MAPAKLAFSSILSRLRPAALGAASGALLAAAAAAHEIRPAVVDVEAGAERLTLTIRLSLEAMVAGIDLDGLEDTDDAPEADRYDALRALDPEALAAATRDAWPELAGGFRLSAGNAALEPDLTAVSVPEAGDLNLPRDSILTLTAALPADDSPVTVGWIPSYGPLVVRQIDGSADAYAAYLFGGQTSDPLPRTGTAAQGALQAFGQYLAIGFLHIVPKGLDHILFVLGLFFLSLRMRSLLLQITAFTLAHAATLACSALGLAKADPNIVEPLIAASIVYVAAENVFLRTVTPWRVAVVFGFGLLHGLGFASALNESGLSPARFASGLIAFNIGVELGQIAAVACAYLSIGHWFGGRPWYRARIAIPASLAIGCAGAYWFVERAFL